MSLTINVGEFGKCVSQDSLASALGTTSAQLVFHLYSAKAPPYRLFTIPKASGEKRTIAVPPPVLMAWQRRLSEYLTASYLAKPSVHGFAKGRSICSNASEHVGRRLILNIDLRDFFPSIHFGRVRGLFASYPFKFSNVVASTLAQLCTREGKLPQGAPTSPIISNLICRRLDNDLWKLTRSLGCKYTRYADDITISTNDSEMPSQIVRAHDPSSGIVNLGDEIQAIFARHHFSVNEMKSRMHSADRRQEVTGLTVNRRVNVNREYIRDIRAILHDWGEYGEAAAKKKFEIKDAARMTRYGGSPTLGDHIAGKLEFLTMVRGAGDPIYTKYAIIARKLSVDLRAPVLCGKSAEITSFLQEALWVVVTLDSQGNPIPRGTAFTLNGFGIVSAAHVFTELEEITGAWQVVRATNPHDAFPIHMYRHQPGLDLALISTDAKSNATFRRSQRSTEIGDDAVLVGFPNWHTYGDLPVQIATKVIQAKPISGVTYIGVNYAILSGASGGPVLDYRREVAGVIANGSGHKIMPNSFVSIRHIDAVLQGRDVQL